MRILVYGINYHPELTGIGKYTGELCAWFAERGHHVEVVTAMPYYPGWEVEREYKGKKWFTEEISGVCVRRSPLYVSTRINAKKRIVHEFSFLLSSLVQWIRPLWTRYDVVISIYPPLVIGLYPYIYKLIHKRPWVFHIQDLQVDAAKELGMIKNSFVLNCLFSIERFFLNQAARVGSISPGMKQKILNKGVAEEKYIHLPNWVDTGFIYPTAKDERLKKELGFGPEDRLILYSGNMGEKQGLELVIEVAEQMRAIPHLHFLMAGEGASRERLEEQVKKMQLANVHFLPLMPYSELTRFMNIADAHLVLQKREASDLVLPSKLNTILSAGGLAIVSAVKDTTLYNLVREHNVGIVIEPESAAALRDAIEGAIEHPHTEVRSNARNYALENLNIDKILGRFETQLKELL